MSNFKKFVAGFATIAMAITMGGFMPVQHANAATAGEVYKTTDGTVWFITDNMTKRPFTSAGAFMSYGFLSFSQVKEADSSVNSLPTGSFIAPQDGRIFCATETKGSDVSGECSLVTAGKKAAFTSASVFSGQGYSFARAYYGDSSFLEKTSNIDNASAQHRPGTLINNNGTVQLVVAGGLWGVPSMDVFNAWGWSFADVVPANSADVLLSQTGIIPARMAGELVPTATTGGGSNPGNCNSLEGSAGDITVSDKSTYSSEDVAEGEEEVPVYSFEVKADNDSDVAITSIKVELMQGTVADSEDIEDYMDSVQIMMGDDVIGEADAEDFNEDSDVYSKNIALDCAFVGAGDTEELTIAVSAINNIDGSDLDTAVWNVGVSQVRFEDGDGVTTTESFTLDVADDTIDDTLEEQFTFEAEGQGEDISITSSSEDPDPTTLLVSDDEESDEYDVFAFRLEAEESDISLDDLVLTVTTGTETYNEVVQDVSLEIDGESFDDVEVADGNSTTADLTFDIDGDYTIDADEDVTVMVVMTFRGADNYTDGATTVKVQTVSVSGEGVEDVDDTVTVTGSTHTLATAVPEVSDVELTSDVNDPAKSGVISLQFKIKAVGDNVDFNVANKAAVNGATDDVRYTVLVPGGSSSAIVGTASLVSGDATADGTGWIINQGDEATFAVDIVITTDATADNGVYRVRLDSVEGITIDELSPKLVLSFSA